MYMHISHSKIKPRIMANIVERVIEHICNILNLMVEEFNT